jgi:hypothetical protein
VRLHGLARVGFDIMSIDVDGVIERDLAEFNEALA